MPIEQKLLEIWCCTTTRVALKVVPTEKLQNINALIAQGKLKFADGNAVEKPLVEGLMTEDGSMLYRIDDDIPVMLPEKAIPLENIL